MNFITNFLYIFYIKYLLNFSETTLLFMFFGLLIPYLGDFLKFKKRYFHSLPILLVFNIPISAISVNFVDITFINIYISFFFGVVVHLTSDILRSKPIYLLYPLSKRKLFLSLIDYFDPTIILVFSFFMLLFSIDGVVLPQIIKISPIIFTILYTLFKLFFKYRLKNQYKNGISKRDTLIITSGLTPFLWRVIVKKEFSIVVYIKHIFKKDFLSIRHFKFLIKEDTFKIINKSKNFDNFKSEFCELFIQDIVIKNRRVIRIYDVFNFISLFKREQSYIEIDVDSQSNIISEKVIL